MMKTIRNVTGPSSYFRGVYNRYGRYQWNVKLSNISFDDIELEQIQDMFLGEYVKNKNGKYGYTSIKEHLGREVESHLDGRSGGWLVINTELTDDEVLKIDAFVRESLESIPSFLKEIRDAE